jgi:hypothetical protein
MVSAIILLSDTNAIILGLSAQNNGTFVELFEVNLRDGNDKRCLILIYGFDLTNDHVRMYWKWELNK